MNNSNDKFDILDNSELLRETAIFDYVAENQSASARRNFEKMMAQDPSLQEAVNQEMQLRQSMQEAGALEPVSMSNFAALLETIEIEERQSTHSDQATASNSGIESAVVTSIFKSRGRSLSKYSTGDNSGNAKRYYASVASIAIVGMVFGGFYLNSTTPEFQTLSDTDASQKINFAKLTEQTRLAKLTFSNNVTDDQVTDLLLNFGLTSFEAGAAPNQRFVIAKSAISEDNLNRLRADTRIQYAELFVVTNGE